MKGWSATGLAALALGVAPAIAQPKPPASDVFELTGVLADAKGPLAKRVVTVSPLDAQGNPLRIRSLSGPSSGTGLNPRATTDASGRFSVQVSRSFFRGYREGEAGVGASEDIGSGRFAVAHETAIVKIDPKAAKVDVGRVVLQPLKPKGLAR
jgi:hypothetical protein